MNRRAALEPICTHSWKWFDVGSGKWCTYAQPNNKTIDDDWCKTERIAGVLCLKEEKKHFLFTLPGLFF